MFDLNSNERYQQELAASQAAFDNAQTDEERAAISKDWQERKNVYQYYSGTYNSTFEGAEGSGISDELRWDQQEYNLPLLESLRRTYGKDATDKELIDQWMYDQRYMNNNLSNLGWNTAKIGAMDEQQKKDFALQMLTYDQIAATGEGSAPLWEQTLEVGWAMATDVTNLVGLGTFGIGLLGREGIKESSKAGLKEALRQFFIKPSIKRAATIGATEGAVYTTAFDSFKQSQEYQLGLKEDWDWGRTGSASLMGAALGGTLGGAMVAAPQQFGKLLTKIKVNNDYDNTQMMRLLEEAGQDEAAAENLLVSGGLTREEAASLLNKHKKVQERKQVKPDAAAAVTKVKEESGFQRTLGDVVSSMRTRLEKINLGNIADDIDDAIIKKEQYQGRYASTFDKYKKDIDMNDPALASRVRNNKPKNDIEAKFINDLRRANTERANALYKAGVISAETLGKFIQNKSYLPRVWNTRYLSEEKGAKQLADFINSKAARSDEGRKAANDLIESLTGKKNYLKDKKLVEVKFIRDAMRNKDREVRRSTHVDYERKLKGFSEDELDQFMMPFEARMKLAQNDIANRLAFAENFGANDEKVSRLVDQLRSQGMKNEANLVNEAYGIAARIPKTETSPFGSAALGSKIEQPAQARLAEGVNAYQTWKMYMAAIPNLPQAFINSFTAMAGSGITRAGINSLRGPMKALFRDADTVRILKESGILSELELQRYISEGLENARVIDMDLKGPLRVLNEPTAFLRAVGFMGVEKMNRMIAGSAGIVHAKGLHAKYTRLMQDAAPGKLKQMRINKLRQDMKNIGIKDPDVTKLSDEQLSYVANKFNNIVNYTNEYHNLPKAWQFPLGKVIFKFKSFMYNHSRFLNNNVIKPLKKGDPRPMVAYLTSAGTLGGAMLQLRESLTGMDYQENAEPLEWLANGVLFAGGAGLLFDIVSAFSDKYGNVPYRVGQAFGPTAGDIFRAGALTSETIDKGIDETIDDIIKSAFPMTKPVMNVISY